MSILNESIIQDLKDTQTRLDYLLDKCSTDNDDCGECKSNEAQELSEVMSMIVVWLMQNGYVEA